MLGSRQTRPLFYPARQLHHVCRVDAEEDVKDFRPLRPGLDPSEIVVLFCVPNEPSIAVALTLARSIIMSSNSLEFVNGRVGSIITSQNIW